jgi:hypothetical protein
VLDLIMLALVVICFASAMAYAALCDELVAPPAGKGVSM